MHAGERRLRAAKILGLASVPAIVRQADEQQKLELALVENLQREDLNSIETAVAYRKLIDEFNLSQEELAVKVGRSRPVITNTLRFLNLPEEIQAALIEGKITEGHAKVIVGLESEVRQLALYKKILLNKMTVDDSLKETRAMGGTKQARIKINYADKDKEFAFRQFFGTKAEVKRKGKGGEIIIYFYSDEELGDIIRKIKN
ncbi:ParB/RepB/Spo0J family partition protein [Candidatus Falkowbacteria bacterium]|nr:ParB/RepB/Spo0J family partition protein [Candidatus Falkowbacteria bacterium]